MKDESHIYIYNVRNKFNNGTSQIDRSNKAGINNGEINWSPL